MIKPQQSSSYEPLRHDDSVTGVDGQLSFRTVDKNDRVSQSPLPAFSENERNTPLHTTPVERVNQKITSLKQPPDGQTHKDISSFDYRQYIKRTEMWVESYKYKIDNMTEMNSNDQLLTLKKYVKIGNDMLTIAKKYDNLEESENRNKLLRLRVELLRAFHKVEKRLEFYESSTELQYDILANKGIRIPKQFKLVQRRSRKIPKESQNLRRGVIFQANKVFTKRGRIKINRLKKSTGAIKEDLKVENITAFPDYVEPDSDESIEAILNIMKRDTKSKELKQLRKGIVLPRAVTLVSRKGQFNGRFIKQNIIELKSKAKTEWIGLSSEYVEPYDSGPEELQFPLPIAVDSQQKESEALKPPKTSTLAPHSMEHYEVISEESDNESGDEPIFLSDSSDLTSPVVPVKSKEFESEDPFFKWIEKEKITLSDIRHEVLAIKSRNDG
ncbi:hypothetical protein WICMUC_002969 [Wickerhamomyces mucosus]|uniref:Uncharacterized protein n=1 Tax=Wickerhamomyces mucosus TaxID=1378264 RepID=A0A9P8TD98_9ASCO|nr:hypothetical protein WICMUC_002969 [Wickerhamomyces mucosus]